MVCLVCRSSDLVKFLRGLPYTGVLAVTRSLGDSSMKEFVVGSPYTTETTLGAEDQFLIVACDGVSTHAWLYTPEANCL